MLTPHVNFTYPRGETPVNYWSIPLYSMGVGYSGGVIDRCISYHTHTHTHSGYLCFISTEDAVSLAAYLKLQEQLLLMKEINSPPC